MGSDIDIDISAGDTVADVDVSTSKTSTEEKTDKEQIDVVEEDSLDTGSDSSDENLITPKEAEAEKVEVNTEEAFTGIKEVSHIKMRDISTACLLLQYNNFLKNNSSFKNIDPEKEIKSICVKMYNLGYCSPSIYSIYNKYKKKNTTTKPFKLEDLIVDEIVDETLEVIPPEEVPTEIREVYEETSKVLQKFNKVMNTYKLYLKNNMGKYFFNKTKDKIKFLVHPDFNELL